MNNCQMNHHGPPKPRNKSVSFQNDNGEGDYNRQRPRSYIESSESEMRNSYYSDMQTSRTVTLLADANMTISLPNDYKNQHKGKSKNNKHDKTGYDDSSQFLSNLPFIRNNQNNNYGRQYESYDDSNLPPRFENQHYQNNAPIRGGNYRGFEKSKHYSGPIRGGSANRGRGGNYRGVYVNNYPQQDFNDFSNMGTQPPPSMAPHRGRGGFRGPSSRGPRSAEMGGRRFGNRGGNRGRGNKRNYPNKKNKSAESNKEDENEPKSPSTNEEIWEENTSEEFRMYPSHQKDECTDQNQTEESVIKATDNEVNKESSVKEFHDVQQDSNETKEVEKKEEPTKDLKNSQNEDKTPSIITDVNSEDKVSDTQTKSEIQPPEEDLVTEKSETNVEKSQTSDDKEKISDAKIVENTDASDKTANNSQSTEEAKKEDTK